MVSTISAKHSTKWWCEKHGVHYFFYIFPKDATQNDSGHHVSRTGKITLKLVPNLIPPNVATQMMMMRRMMTMAMAMMLMMIMMMIMMMAPALKVTFRETPSSC